MANETNNEVRVRMGQKELILNSLRYGKMITSYQANSIGHTVDARKYISRLREEGHKIFDYWETGRDGRRYKVYYLNGDDCFITSEWLNNIGFRRLLGNGYFSEKLNIYFRYKQCDGDRRVIRVSFEKYDGTVVFCKAWTPAQPGLFITRGEFLGLIKEAGLGWEEAGNE